MRRWLCGLIIFTLSMNQPLAGPATYGPSLPPGVTLTANGYEESAQNYSSVPATRSQMKTLSPFEAAVETAVNRGGMTSIPTANPRVTYRVGTNSKGHQVTQVVYKSTRDIPEYLMAVIISGIDSAGMPFHRVIHTEETTTYVDALSYQLVTDSAWQDRQIEIYEAEQTSVFKEWFMSSGDDVLNLLFFTWTGIKDLYRTYDYFLSAIHEAEEVRASLDLQYETDREMARSLDVMIREAYEQYFWESYDAWKAIGRYVLVDVITWVPEKVLKPIGFIFSAGAKVATRNAVGRGAARFIIGAKDFVVAGTKKGVLQPLSKAAKIAKARTIRAAIRWGFLSRVSRVRLKTYLFQHHSRTIKMWLNFSTKFEAGGYPKLAAFKNFLAKNCSVNSPEGRRLWMAGFFYGIPFSLIAQLSEKGGVQHFVDDFGRVTHDVLMTSMSTFTLGRCTSNWDKVSEMTVFERWRNRQLFQHISNYNDTFWTWFKMTRDTEGMTPAELDELRKRYISNFTYTLTRGPMIGAVSSMQNGELNMRYLNALQMGDRREMMNAAAHEAVTRFGQSYFSWRVYLHYRDGFTGVNKDADPLTAERERLSRESVQDIQNYLDETHRKIEQERRQDIFDTTP